MRLLADTNIVTAAVERLRADGHDVIYIGERSADPGDEAILTEAAASARVLLTKDHDTRTLVFKKHAAHAGVLLIDDLGSSPAETQLIVQALARWSAELAAGAFVRAGNWGSKRATDTGTSG